ncbi:MAG TPA: glycosyltransferase family 4 protein [Thermoanaerobaculia bacterium]|nr:glycosyltransferase family 4 protein [Thermoanaerobaculia bacterium]
MTSRSFAMVTTFYPPESFGGDGLYVERLAKALVRRGHRVTVVACRDAYRICGGASSAPPLLRSSAPPLGVEVVRLESPAGPLSPLATQMTGRPFFKRRALERVLAPGRFDAVHFHNISLVGGPGVLALAPGAVKLYTLHEHWLLCPTHVFWKEKRKLCDRKTCFSCQVLSDRPPQLWRYGPFLRDSLGNVDLFLSPSRFTMERHRAEGLDFPMRVLPLFVPEASARSPVPERPVFLYAGRLDRSKGPDALVAAAAGLNAEIRIAGDGPRRHQLEEEARRTTNVRILGPLTPERVGEEMAGARAVVAPSRCLETFGFAAAEAMMRGVPVVARRRGGLGEIVEESGGGLLFEEDSELPALLARLASDPELAAELGARGRDAATRLWLEERHLSEYLALVESLLERRKSA